MTEADILALTYTDFVHVWRAKKASTVAWDPEAPFVEVEGDIVYENLPAAVSYREGSSGGPTETVQPVHYMAKLFVRPEVKIEAGDVIRVEPGFRYYTAGEGVGYPSHNEIPLIRGTKA